jgi:hypothetical protein
MLVEREIDMSIIGAGMKTLSWCLCRVVSGHLFTLAGEVALLKRL